MMMMMMATQACNSNPLQSTGCHLLGCDLKQLHALPLHVCCAAAHGTRTPIRTQSSISARMWSAP
jgi:hypothetical protein